MNNAEGVGCLGVECAEAREASSQAERGTVAGPSLHYVFWLFLCGLVSLKSRLNPGLLVLDFLAGNGSLAPMQISPLFLFKKEYPGLTKLRISTKRALARFVPSQSSPAANPVSARRLLGSSHLALKPLETSF